MPPWVKKIFLVWMPKVLMLRRPRYSASGAYDDNQESGYVNDGDFRYATHALAS
ncbi:unnamed protein product [Nesidiocoris tenuis]|uniref:Uncharacterized protein n=1 Tax=Nesidiocoris tenuis TaxID=355587 RepID=A0A6H5FWY1_9HEMI|nr:unnamed protein product [Nesidiocoris tenuis]